MREQLIQYVNLLFAGNDNAEDIRQEILQNTLDRYDDLIFQGKTPDAAYRSAISGIGDLDEILGEKYSAEPRYAPAVCEVPGIPVSRIIRAFAVGLYIISLTPLIFLDSFNLGKLEGLGVIGTLLIIAAATALMILFPKKKTGNGQEPSIPMPEASVIRTIRAVAIAMYVCSIAPLILLDSLGLDNLGVCLTLFIVAAATVLIMIYRQGKNPAPTQEAPVPSDPRKELKKSVGKFVDTLGVVAYFLISFRTGAWHITWLIFLMMPAVKGLVNAILDLKGE